MTEYDELKSYLRINPFNVIWEASQVGGEGVTKGTKEIRSVTSVFHLVRSSAGYLVCDDFEMFLSCAIK